MNRTNNKPHTIADIQIDDCWNKIGVWRKTTTRCEKLQKVIHCYNCEVYSDAGRSLLDRERPVNYNHEWAEVIARESIGKATDLTSVIIFRLGAEWLALPVPMVREITLLRNIMEIPHNHNRKLRGMVNLRGELVICMSLGYLLGVDKPEENNDETDHLICRLIMIREGSGHVVFPVSEIQGITRYLPEDLNKAPDTISNRKLKLINGIIEWQGHHVCCIDENAMMEEIENNIK